VRILHVIPYLHPSAGGPPVVVEHFVKETAKHGISSEIVSAPLFCNGDEVHILQKFNNLAPTSFLPSSGMFATLRRSSRVKLGECIRIADLVHLHTIWNPINIIVRQECSRHSRRYVLMPHGMLDPFSLKVKSWRKAAYLWAIEQRNIQAADRLIFTSEEEARSISTKVVCPRKRVVIPLGADAQSDKSEDLATAFLEKFPQARGRRQLLFLGRLHFKKGLDRILMALPAIIKELPDVLLTIVGDGSSDITSMIERAISNQNLEKYILRTGRLDGRIKWGAFASSSLFLLPSRHENFAIAVVEAMQMGVPVLVSNKVNTWSFVQEAGAGVVMTEEEMAGGLERCILSLLRDGERLRLMGARGRAYARENLTWARSASRLVECYKDVLGLSA